MYVSVDERVLQQEGEALTAYAGSLGKLIQELGQVRGELARQTGFSSQLETLRYLGRAAEESRAHLKGCAQALLESSACYRRTERAIKERFGLERGRTGARNRTE